MKFAPLIEECPARYQNKLILTLGLPYPAWLEIVEMLAHARVKHGAKFTPEQMQAGTMLVDLVAQAFADYALEHETPKGSA